MTKKVIVEFTKMLTTEDTVKMGKLFDVAGMVVPYAEIDVDHIVKIDYGNYGTVNDRHSWPGWQISKGPGTTRPVLIIHTKAGKIIASSAIYFKRQVKFLDEQ